MLPEFSKARLAMHELWNRAMFAGLNGSDPFLNEIPVRMQREGGRANVGGSDMEYKRCSVQHTFEVRNAKGMSLDEFIKIPYKMGQEMAAQQVQSVFQTLQEPTKYSRAVSWEAGKLTFTQLLEIWQSMEINFDANGMPKWPTMVLRPESMTEMHEKFEIWHNDPSCRAQWQEVINNKLIEFNEREARRRLVD